MAVGDKPLLLSSPPEDSVGARRGQRRVREVLERRNFHSDRGEPPSRLLRGTTWEVVVVSDAPVC